MSSEMCCDAHTQGCRVKVLPLILYCASSGGYRVYNYIFIAASIQHWEGGLHVFSHSSVSSWFPSQSKCSSKEREHYFPCFPCANPRCWRNGGPFVPEINGTCSRKEPSFLLPASVCSMCSHCPLLVPCCREAAWLKFWRQVWIVPLYYRQSTGWDHRQPARIVTSPCLRGPSSKPDSSN